MRKYTLGTDPVLTEVVCNCCGKSIPLQNGIAKEDYIHLKKEWGYFSDKDGVTQSFDLCESCYDKWIKTFVVPVSEEEMTELI